MISVCASEDIAFKALVTSVLCYVLNVKTHQTHIEEGGEGHVIVDTTLCSGPHGKVDEPHAGNPEFVVWRWQLLKMPQLLCSHQTWGRGGGYSEGDSEGTTQARGSSHVPVLFV